MPFCKMLSKACEDRRKRDHCQRCFVPSIFYCSGVACVEQFLSECLKKFMASIKVEHVLNCVRNTGNTRILNNIFSGKAHC